MTVNLGPALGLAKDENVVWSGEFPLSFTTYFLKTKAALTDRRVAWERPSTFLGIIPTGSLRETFPLSSIVSVGTKTAIGVWRALFGILFLLSGLASFGRGGWLVALVGLALLASAFQAKLEVVNSGGQKYNLRIVATERDRANQFADAINTTLADRSGIR